jgi:outer membrane receptor protein involved in Fe transport
MSVCAGAQEGDILEDEFELLKEEEIVYTASKHEQDIAESPSAVTVITRGQIENTHCTDVICLLRQVPEVDVRRVLPLYIAVGARALTGELGDKVLVLLDGREENHEMFGMPYWQLIPVHLEDIERIEVIRGPGSALYGANAHSMVVYITTRRLHDNTAEAFLGGGEHDRLSLHLRLGQRFGGWELQLSGGLETAGHWRLKDRREREVGRVRLRADRETETALTSLQLDLVSISGQIYTSIAPGWARDTIIGHFLGSHRVGPFKAQVWFGLWDITVVPDLPLYYMGMKLGGFVTDMDFFNTALDAEVQAELEPFSKNLLIAGVSYRWNTMSADCLTPSSENQHRAGVFVHDEQRLGESLLLTGGIRFDYNNVTSYSISPRLAGVWRFVDDQFLRLAFGRAFRKPPFFNTSLHFNNVVGEPGFEELGDFFLRSVGNRNLRNENVTAFELGYRGQFLNKDLIIEADAFFNLYRDTIVFVTEMAETSLGMPDISKSVMEYRNQGREVDTLGGSVAIYYHFDNDLRLGANYTYRYSWFVAGAAGQSALEGDRGGRVKWERAHLANLSLNYVPPDGIRAGLAIHGDSECDLVMPEQGGLFDDYILVHSRPRLMIGGYLAFRQPVGSGWVEAGIKAFNIMHEGSRDTAAVTRPDGVELGGELLGRRLFLYLRGSI